MTPEQKLVLWMEDWRAALTIQIARTQNRMAFYCWVYKAECIVTGYGSTPQEAELSLLGQLGCF